ncbi:TRAP transporter small permease [Oceanicella sp. SM1341]|uniref:TRAP transporter small permease n=1 Tax=Oceanicella sp. SM1341 TaxID=1548889 RepID=UPI000E50E4E3|nr:TRAP transporter small permease [Oceanicella sp. SM1341]
MRNDGPTQVVAALTKVNMFISGVAILAMLLHVVADIVMREVFHAPFSGTLEIVSYWYMVAAVFLAIPVAQAHGGHIQVELFTAGLSPRRRRILDTGVLLFSIALLVVFTWVSVEEALRQTRNMAMVEAGTGMIPVWPTRWLVPFSMGTMTLICSVQAFVTLRRVLAGDTGEGGDAGGAHV